MSLIDDIRGDFACVVDGLEAVTFRSREQGDTFDETENVTALRRVLTRGEMAMAGNGPAAGETMVWHLEASDLAGVTPKPRDRIKDSEDVEWVITDGPTLNTFGSRWRCTTTKAKG